MKRAYYGKSIAEFLKEDTSSILGELVTSYGLRALESEQRNAWIRQIVILKDQLIGIDGHIYFEFSIPRMGKRVDNVLIVGGIVFLLEFKIVAKTYENYAIDQVIDYALDLRNFHEGSHSACIVPVLVAENAVDVIRQNFDDVLQLKDAVKLNARNLGDFFKQIPKNIAARASSISIENVKQWEESRYRPTPTIIEAAQALYTNHDVSEITRSDAGAANLSITAECIGAVIEDAKLNHKKAICFVTGVPGAGKTLAGLNIANQRLQTAEDEHAVFLSGNGPLVLVLQEALARNISDKKNGNVQKKQEALKQTKAFIQNIHHFRDEYLESSRVPLEKVVIFDEAQRAWNEHQASKFMRQKRGIVDFNQSEPEFLINVMNRHHNWCVIVCLIGGGQEINTGEAGLEAWMQALKNTYKDWEVHYSSLILEDENYLQDEEIKTWLKSGFSQENLHLATSVRSFRSAKVSAFVQALLDVDENAAQLYTEVSSTYPIVMTRDLQKAKQWVKDKAKGSERYGIIASSGARRLKALGVNVKNEIEIENWFLNFKEDVRSSYFLEDVATEFDVQGLELDWVCMAWGGNFHYHQNRWCYQSFKGSKWQNINKLEDQQYTKNAHRVLLTRARQGMVIWIPEGDEQDHTRPKHFYDGTYHYLKSLGIVELVK